jgi:hypothetical protein
MEGSVTAVLSPTPKQAFFDNNGRPGVGMKLFSYVAGTSTKLATYVDSVGVTQNTNPIILDFRGECSLWIPPNVPYKLVLAAANDTDPPASPIWSVDQLANSQLTTLFGGTDTGVTNAYVLTFAANFSAYTTGIVIYWIPSNTNTGPSTVNVNGLGPVAIVNQDGSQLYAGEIRANEFAQIIFQGSEFVLLSDTASAAFSAQRITSAQSMPASTTTTCIFNSTTINQGGFYDTTTGIFTAPSYGLYQFNVLAILLPGGTNCTLNSIYLSKNNATTGAGARFDIGVGLFGQQYSNTGNQAAFAGGTTIEMNAGDTMRVKWSAGTSGVGVNNLGLEACFSGAKVA